MDGGGGGVVVVQCTLRFLICREKCIVVGHGPLRPGLCFSWVKGAELHKGRGQCIWTQPPATRPTDTLQKRKSATRFTGLLKRKSANRPIDALKKICHQIHSPLKKGYLPPDKPTHFKKFKKENLPPDPPKHLKKSSTKPSNQLQKRKSIYLTGWYSPKWYPIQHSSESLYSKYWVEINAFQSVFHLNYLQKGRLILKILWETQLIYQSKMCSASMHQ